MASQLDPTWTEPGEHEKHLITYLTNLTELSESKVGQILCLMIAYAPYCHKAFVARVSYRIVHVYWMCAHTTESEHYIHVYRSVVFSGISIFLH